MLTNRQLQILQVIIDDFIMSAQPVGSRTIAKKGEITFSPATIRNEMADLEEMGFLEKTHSSSGRVPSEKGYRFYVDHLVSPKSLTKDEKDKIETVFTDKIYELEKVAQKSAEILSEFTNYTSIVLGPEVFETRLKQLQIVPISDHTAVVLIVTDTGHVENRTVTVPKDISLSEIEKVVNILNERLRGVSLIDLHRKIQSEIYSVLKVHVMNYENIHEMILGAFGNNKGEKIFYGGKTNMFAQPEFNDIDKIRSLLTMIEKEKVIYDLLRTDKAGLSVKIGQENKFEEMQNCSLITASYSIGTDHLGTIAILGPTRMEYSRVITLLNVISNDLTKALSSLYQK